MKGPRGTIARSSRRTRHRSQMKTLKRIAWSVAAVFLLLVVAAAVRMHEDGALFIEPVEGRRIGYSARTGEWLWLAYPAVPPARDGPYVMREGDRRVAWVLEPDARSEEHTAELQSLMRISYAVFCLEKT